MTLLEWAPDRCAIAGMGTTAYSEGSGVSVTALAAEAALAALSHAGLEFPDIDTMVRSDYGHPSHVALADALNVITSREGSGLGTLSSASGES
jgi:acetyl-CoA acetyltransferase